MGDLRDSKGCLYHAQEGRYYDVAWITTSDYEECKSRGSANLKKLIQETEKYQERCPKSLHEQAKQRRPR